MNNRPKFIGKHPDKNLNDIFEVKARYEDKLDLLLKEFEQEVGIIPFSGGLHIKGIQLIIGHGSTRNYFIQLEL